MKISSVVVALAALSVSSLALAADDGAAVFKKNNCGTCHAPEKKTVGPSLKDIAAKYKDDKEAQAKLEKKVRTGGAGAFGRLPMPATPQSVSDADIKIMVSWMLSQK